MNTVNVIINNKSEATENPFTYLIEENVSIGQKVIVPFGKGNKDKEAYVVSFDCNSDVDLSKLKKVKDIIMEVSLGEEIIETCKWMSRRYFCKLIDCINLFTPVGSKSKRGVREIPHHGNEGEEQGIDTLTAEQKMALKKISSAIFEKEHKIFLLHGVTGSGKTEVYIRSIEKTLKEGRNAIMLVPEISLTKQIIDRFISRFGKEKIAILHSRLSIGQRYDEWQRIKSGQVDIVIGARSAIFAPLDNIGLVIFDEEHESTYKSDMTPKYETLEVAIKRVKAYSGSIILGSATPSVVSYNRAIEGVYEYIPMKERYNNNKLPKVDIVNMQDEIKKGNETLISKKLYNEMKNTLHEGKQIILFLNRRGYSTFMSCMDCGYVVKCPHCEISLTYHKDQNALVCHYCGYKLQATKTCPECKGKHLRYLGHGTEKVTEEVEKLFENKTVARLDLDTAQKKGAIEKILNDFEKSKIDILTGTQIVAKGLDFRNVGLVGIVLADTALNIPDFRSSERCFQLITQASGRAGRGDEEGKVIIQTYCPDNYSILHGANQDFIGFFETEIKMREFMDYPPFSDLVQMVVSSSKEDIGEKVSKIIKKNLKYLLGEDSEKNIFNPQKMVSVTRGIYKYYILLKCPKDEKGKYMGAIKAVKENLKEKKLKDVNLAIDINPYSLWRG